MKNKEQKYVSNCCAGDMVEPDDEITESMGSLWRAYDCYLCKSCGKPCDPVNKNKK